MRTRFPQKPRKGWQSLQKTYCTEEKMILNEIHHMELLEFKKRKRSARTVTNSDDENLNTDWENVYRERKLNKL